MTRYYDKTLTNTKNIVITLMNCSPSPLYFIRICPY